MTMKPKIVKAPAAKRSAPMQQGSVKCCTLKQAAAIDFEPWQYDPTFKLHGGDTMTTKPKARKTPVAATCINPKLIALATKVDAAETELKRVLTDVREPADLHFFANREDKAAQAAMKVADAAEGAACDASGRAAEKFSKVRATNLQELILKARHADVNFIDDVVALSIVGDLLAIGGKP